MNNTRQIKIYIGTMVASSVTVAGYACFLSHQQHAYLALAVLALAAASSRMKVKLPGINGNMSINLPFLLTAVMNLSAAEAVLITCASTAVECWPRKNAKLNAQQMTFNLSMMVFATSVATLLARAQWLAGTPALQATTGLLLASAALFFGQTLPVAGIVAMSERKRTTKIWKELAHLSFPYYVVSAGVTSMVEALGVHLGWGLALAVFPVMYGIHRSYRMYFSHMVESMRADVLVRAVGAGA
jgi:hypothetical protein